MPKYAVSLKILSHSRLHRSLNTAGRYSPRRLVLNDMMTDLKVFAGKAFSIESDPGKVKGTKLRVLKYPHPQVVLPFSR